MSMQVQDYREYLQEILIPEEQLQQRIAELAAEISRDYEGKLPLLICILRGGVMFLTDLIRYLTIPHEIDFMAIESYGQGRRDPGEIRLTMDLHTTIRGRHVLLVEDIIDTGNTVAQVLELLQVRQPKSLKVCVLLDKHGWLLAQSPLHRGTGFEPLSSPEALPLGGERLKTAHPLPALALEVRHLLPSDLPVHLVGGAVRDWLLQRPVMDLDFVVPEDALKWARKVANDLDADFFPLDPQRGIGRVLVHTPQGLNIIDFADYRAPTLEEDLRQRDFTINAMALDPLRPDQLIDPLHGLQDLLDRRLRLCSPQALEEDPVRVLRAVRLALDLELHIEPDTRRRMREAVAYLNRVSPERVREELFKIFELKRCPSALRVLLQLGALEQILPEAAAMKGVAGYRPRGVVFVLGVLYHDVGKTHVGPEHPDREAHARVSATLVARRARALRLARSEIRWLERLVRHHMWPQRFHQELPEPRALYRFYRETDEAGVLVGLLHLANLWSKAGFRMDRTTWEHHVDVVRRLWEAWWERRALYSPAMSSSGNSASPPARWWDRYWKPSRKPRWRER